MRVRRLLIAVLLLAGLQAGSFAHEVPNEVTVLAFLKPEGQTLRFLVRAPMASLRDVSVPVFGPGYLQISAADAAFRDAATLWISDFVELYENGRPLPKPTVRAVRAELPSSRSFQSYEAALADVLGPPLPDDTNLYWEQGVLDVLFEYPITSDQSQFAIHPGFTRLGLQVNVGLRFLAPGQPERVFDVHADVGVVELDPRWHQAAWLFVKEGFWHILDGTDHLLFLLCLVLPFRRFRPLLVVVTAFTLAHSVTLLASAYGLAPDALWFPPLVETLIAASIVYMALENILGVGLQRRWIMTFAFGLVHGFGFSFVLRERLQFAGSHLLSSLLAFNVGVELGQLLVLAVLIPALGWLFTRLVAERTGVIIMSALVAHTAWHWMTDRWAALSRFPLPALDALALAALMRWAMAAIVVALLLWWVSGIVRRWEGLPNEPRTDAN
ncbi:MAG TPA: HupE/UreJ family protein [Vicinamibacterales bacterium]|nr:HupE/UreJ family protein [Vicinamibacterales bacterium]